MEREDRRRRQRESELSGRRLEQRPHRPEQQQIPDERVDLKRRGAVSAADPVIDRERRLQHRPVGLIERQHAERRRVDEVPRHVSNFADERVVDNGVAVVEVEAVPEVVGVGGEEQGQDGERVTSAHGRPHQDSGLQLVGRERVGADHLRATGRPAWTLRLERVWWQSKTTATHLSKKLRYEHRCVGARVPWRRAY